MRILIALLLITSCGLVACTPKPSQPSINHSPAETQEGKEHHDRSPGGETNSDVSQRTASKDRAQDTSSAFWKNPWSLVSVLTPFFAAALAFLIGKQWRSSEGSISVNSKADRNLINELSEKNSQLIADIQKQDIALKNAEDESDKQKDMLLQAEHSIQELREYLASIERSILPNLNPDAIAHISGHIADGDKDHLQFIGAYLSLLGNPGSRHNQLEMSESVYKILPVPEHSDLDFKLKKHCNEIAGFTLFRHVTEGEQFDPQLHDSKSGHGPYVSKIYSYIVLDEAGRVVRKASVEQSTSK